MLHIKEAWIMLLLYIYIINFTGTGSQNPILTANAAVQEFQSINLTCYHNGNAVQWWRKNEALFYVASATPCIYSDKVPSFMQCDCKTPLYDCELQSLNISFDKDVWKCSVNINSADVFSNEIVLNITGQTTTSTESKTDTTTSTESKTDATTARNSSDSGPTTTSTESKMDTTTVKDSYDSGLSDGEIAGIGVGATACCCAIAGGTVLVNKALKKKKNGNTTNEDNKIDETQTTIDMKTRTESTHRESTHEYYGQA